MSIKLITFDLDDTLWDNVPVIISAEASMREWLAVHASKVGDLPRSTSPPCANRYCNVTRN